MSPRQGANPRPRLKVPSTSLRKDPLVRPRIATAIAVVLVLVFTACGGSDDTGDENGANAQDETVTSDIDICALLSDEEIAAAIGTAPAHEPTSPAGPFTGCKWGNGLLFVQIAPATTLITAPTEVDCPSAGVGDESTACLGSVKFLTNGIHTSISTIENVTPEQMIEVAKTLLPKLQD